MNPAPPVIKALYANGREGYRGRRANPALQKSRLRSDPVPSTRGRAARKPDRKGASRELFERFTERARQVVVLAQDEARALKHNYIGTEHILLGLLREEEGLAARVLESLDITVEEVRAQVARIVGQGDEVEQRRNR